MQYRSATPDDAPLLAQMNHRLIRDEGHRNPMTVAELEARMRRWLETDYHAVLFLEDGRTPAAPLGYALYKHEPDFIYLRHFFIEPDRRRQHLGTAAFQWLLANTFRSTPRLRVEVLTTNARALGFWHAQQFTDYSLTLEHNTKKNG
jgi:GNAT superfamily N-acetyltransferase